MRQVGQHGRAVLGVGEGGERTADAKACLSDGRGCRGGGLVEEDVVAVEPNRVERLGSSNAEGQLLCLAPGVASRARCQQQQQVEAVDDGEGGAGDAVPLGGEPEPDVAGDSRRAGGRGSLWCRRSVGRRGRRIDVCCSRQAQRGAEFSKENRSLFYRGCGAGSP